MNRHLHNSEEIFNSPQYGWEQMRLLLDKNLPVKNKKSNTQFYAPFIVAASLITIFLFSSLVLQNNGHLPFFSNRLPAAASNQRVSKNNLDSNNEIFANPRTVTKIYAQPYRVPKDLSTRETATGNDIQPNQIFTRLTKIVMLPAIEAVVKKPAKHLGVANSFTGSGVNIAAKPTTKAGTADLTTTAKKDNKNDRKNSWDLSAGVAMNGMIGQRQNLQPFPAAELRYNFSSRFYMSVGLLAGSPVSTDSRGVNKKVFLNDTVNNIRFYDKAIIYNRLYYADIPLLAAMNVGKRFSVQGGLQASVLLGTKTETSITSYDFQMRAANIPQNSLVSVAAAVSENNYKTSVRKIDYRFTTGVKYSINKTSFNLMYQYSLRPVFEGNYISRNKNQLVTLSVLYRLK